MARTIKNAKDNGAPKKKAAPEKKTATPKKKALSVKKTEAPKKKVASPEKKVTGKSAEKAKAEKAEAAAAKRKVTAAARAAKKLVEKKAAAAESAKIAAAEAAKRNAPAKTKKPVKLTVFVKKQRQKLLDLRDALVDQMNGVARDSRSADDSSAFGMHQADAGSDAYDRDFALNLISQEQDAIFEIEQALQRIALGTYGICEVSGDKIPQPRLEAIPFARLTVTCQEKVESQEVNGLYRQPLTSLFGLNESDTESADDDEK